MKRYLVRKIGLKGMNKIIFPLGWLITVSLLVSSPSYAVPNLISYQGVLNDASGNPVNNTSLEMTFSIYDVETARRF